MKKKDLYMGNKTPGIYGVLIVLYIWIFGLGLTSVAAAGFGIYYVLFLILGAVLLVTCPCIGLGVIGATLGIWGLLLTIAIGILIYTATFATLVAVFLPLTLFAGADSKTFRSVLLVFIIHCVVGFYLVKTGAIDLVLGDGLPSVEKIKKVINSESIGNSSKKKLNDEPIEINKFNPNQSYDNLINTLPYDLIGNTKYKNIIDKTLKTKSTKSKVESYFETGFPISKEGKFIYGSGCRSHECTFHDGFFYINTHYNDIVFITYDNNATGKNIFAYYTRDGALLNQRGDSFFIDREAPQALIKWLEQRGVVIVNPNQDKYFKYDISENNNKRESNSVVTKKPTTQKGTEDVDLTKELFRKGGVNYY